jgi:hypothetical protein
MTSFIFTLSIKLMSPVIKVWNETCFAYLKKKSSLGALLPTYYLYKLPLIFCSRIMFVYILVCLNSYYYLCFVLLSVNTNLHFPIPLHRPCLWHPIEKGNSQLENCNNPACGLSCPSLFIKIKI